jgi:hypothetical protein
MLFPVRESVKERDFLHEFDALAGYSEGEPLNHEWQTCAASFVKPHL